MRDIQQWDAVKKTTLTASGGATPSVTGEYCDFAEVDSNFSLVLINAGDSTSLTVTYQLGYLADGVTEHQAKSDPSTYITWMTPADGGAVATMTAVDINASVIHASLTLAVAKFYRFTITNNDAVNGADSVKLIMIAQF